MNGAKHPLPGGIEPTAVGDGGLARRNFLKICTLGAAAIAAPGSIRAAEPGGTGAPAEVAIPYVRGKFRHVLSPPGATLAKQPANKWYINDHCFLVDAAGTIHWFGINNPYPARGGFYGPGSHRHIGHATAKHPFGPWTAHPHALSLPDNTQDGIGACFVDQAGGKYRMWYGLNSKQEWGLVAVESDDLFAWRRNPELGMIAHDKLSRDPCILDLEDGRKLFYGVIPSGIGLFSSRGGSAWKQEPPALVSGVLVGCGALESPFVLKRRDWFYLLVNYSHHQYAETIVFASKDPSRFDWSAPLCTLFTHAAEVLEWQGRTYISHCGIEDQHWREGNAPNGLWLAELAWCPA